MRPRRLVRAVLAVLLLTLSACMPPERLIQIASTDGSETELVFGVYNSDPNDFNEDHGHPIASTVTLHDYTDEQACDVTFGVGMTPPAVMVREAATGKILWRAPVDDFSLCHGDRLVWDGETVIRLDEDDPWPDGVFVPDVDDMQRYPDYS